jgi:hypothetical protein
MSSNGKNGAISWKRVLPVMAMLSLMAIVFIAYSPDAFAGDKGKPTTSPPGLVVAAQVAADQTVIDALADGNVTRGEYDRAVNNTMACIDAKGIPHSSPVYEDFRDRPVWKYVVGPLPEDQDNTLIAEYDECWAKYERDVQSKWVEQHKPSQAKQAANEQAALQCARREGLGVATFKELLDLRRARPDNVERNAVNNCITVGADGYDPGDHR